jgi:hypothetical protein
MARIVGFDRDRSFYPTLLIIIASYYVLFAVMGDGQHELLVEILIASAFILVALAGFRTSPWLVVAGLVCHATFDAFHAVVVGSAGAPTWWPAFCGAYDVMLATLVALKLVVFRVPQQDWA